ncbi:major facilitator superfamily domain-containing protein [Suillus bovinus]|uniref:major facilitator superfamily domain-containing protein n=1 Tax=Suillus bovinus TaxID=48563 RepID=UPI001B8746D4|nr:major facilitator superfamily domain-containing protein [Suillus bovinus]KAG2152570.1 major facilitator superfamily domain-containing protein [Suillus bovinus]
MTVFGCFLMQFCTFGYVSSFGVYQGTQQSHDISHPKLINDLGRLLHANLYDQPTTICNIMDWCIDLVPRSKCHINLGSAVRSRVVVSCYISMHRRLSISRKITNSYRLMIVGSLLQSLSLFALSFAKPGQFYLAFMVQGVLSGFGMGLTYGPGVAVISQHFSRKRTLVMSLVTSGSPLGSMIHPIMLNHLLNGTVGFAGGVRASAGFVSALLLIACLCMRTRGSPVPTVGYAVVARKCSREALFILMTVGSTLFQIGFYYPIFYLQLDSTKHGIDKNFSFYSLVMMNAACFIGRCMTGIIAAYIGVLNFTIVSSVACSAITISMIALSDVASVVVLGVAYGYFSGIFIALIVPLVAVLTPDLSELGARMGICFAFTGMYHLALFSELLTVRECSGFGGLLGGPLSGALLGSQYTWWIASLFSGLISLVGSLFFVVMRLMIYRRGISGSPSIAGGDT